VPLDYISDNFLFMDANVGQSIDSSIISLGIDNTAGVKVVRIEQVNQGGQTWT